MDFGNRHGDARRSSPLLRPSSSSSSSSSSSAAADGYLATQASLLAGRGQAVGPRYPRLHREVSEEERSALYRELKKKFQLQNERLRSELMRERWLAELRRQASVYPPELLTPEYLDKLYLRMYVGFGGTLPPSPLHRPEVELSDILTPPPPHLPENVLGEMLPPSLPHRLENGLGGRLPPSLPHHLEFESGGSLPPSLPHHLEVGFGERLLPSRPRHLESTERPPPLPCHNPVIRENPHVLHAESVIKNKPWPHRKPREQEEIILTKGKMATGINRKAETIAEADDISQAAKKSWSCSLCQVSTTCEQGLKEHLKGKKHKAMEGSLETNIITAENSGTSISLAKEVDKAKEAGMPLLAIKAKEYDKPVQPKVAPVKGPAEKNTSGVKRQKQEVQQQEPFWCEVCKVKYYSQVLLDSHLNGKKHKAQVEHPPENKKPVGGEESQKDNQHVKDDDKPVEEANNKWEGDVEGTAGCTCQHEAAAAETTEVAH